MIVFEHSWNKRNILIGKRSSMTLLQLARLFLNNKYCFIAPEQVIIQVETVMSLKKEKKIQNNK